MTLVFGKFKTSYGVFTLTKAVSNTENSARKELCERVYTDQFVHLRKCMGRVFESKLDSVSVNELSI